MSKLNTYRFEIFFGTLLLQLLYPFIALLFLMPKHSMQLVSFSLLVFASFNLAMKRLPKLLTILFGTISVVGLWCHYLFDDPVMLQFLIVYASCFFYIVLVYILTQNFLVSKSINIKVVIGALSGYLLIGLLGASTIEMMQLHHAGSFNITQGSNFDFTYFSFISMLTVGYGDIIPVSNSAKSLTILISLFGQFYMAVGIASLVGKFMKKE